MDNEEFKDLDMMGMHIEGDDIGEEDDELKGGFGGDDDDDDDDMDD